MEKIFLVGSLYITNQNTIFKVTGEISYYPKSQLCVAIMFIEYLVMPGLWGLLQTERRVNYSAFSQEVATHTLQKTILVQFIGFKCI